MSRYPKSDERLEKVETVTIPFNTFKKALKRNHLTKPDQWGRKYYLRLYPPFEAEMEAEYYEKEQGAHYDNNWDEKPFHIPPELIILDGTDRGFRGIVNWPKEYEIRNALTEDEIEEEGGIESSLEIASDLFWHELESILPDEFDLGNVSGFASYPVELNWEINDE